MDELSHLENLPDRIPVLAAAGLIFLAALGLGELVLKALGLRAWARPLERTALAFGLGTAGLGVLTLLAGRAGLLSPWIFRVGLGLIALAGLGVSRPWKLSRPSINADHLLLTTLVVGPFLVIMLLGSMLPSIDFDVLEYHLQGPKEYYQAGRISFLPHNVYTNMPFGVEMLHLLGMEVLGDWWWGGLVGQFLVALYAPAAAVLIAGAAGRVAGSDGRLVRRDRLSVNALDLPPGRDLLRGGSTLLLPCRAPLGGDPRLDRPESGARAALGSAGAAGRRSDGVQVPGLDLGGDPLRAAGHGRLLAMPLGPTGRWPTSWAGRS